MSTQPTLRFSAIGLNHNHIYGQVGLMLRAGARFVSFYAPEPELVSEFSKVYPDATLARSAEEILEDESIHLILSAGIPCGPRAARHPVMQHGKDYMSDKPGFTTLAQLAEARRVQAETKRIYSICYSERFEWAPDQASEAGQGRRDRPRGADRGLGPHRIHPPARPAWFYQHEKYGGFCATSHRTRWISSSGTPAPRRPRSSLR